MTSIGNWMATATDLPRLDCEVLLSHTLGLTRAQVIAFPETKVSPNDSSTLNGQAQRLREGTPIAYILGTVEFWGLDFLVTPDVLIPRPETELLVEISIDLAPAGGHIIDLGTGSGAIAIAVAHERKDLTVAATDKNLAALAIAQRNAKDHEVAVSFSQSDWFESIQGKWDVIISNPPYIAANDRHLPALVAEPTSALVAGQHGLDDLRQIIKQAANHLKPKGYVLLEHGYDQAKHVRFAMRDAGFGQVESKRDLANIERVCIGRLQHQHG